MALLIEPPTTVEVIPNKTANILPPGLQYKIYAMDLVSLKGSKEVTLLENGEIRWKGWIKQKQNPVRLDFGNTGWELEILDVETSGKMTLIVNLLQWGILQ